MTNSIQEINQRLQVLLKNTAHPRFEFDETKSILTDILISGKIITPTQANAYLEDATGYKSMDPGLVSFSSSFLDKMSLLIPKNVLVEQCAFPIKQDDDVLHIVQANPFDQKSTAILESWVGSRIKQYVSNSQSINKCVAEYYSDDSVALPTDIDLLLEQATQKISQIVHQENLDRTMIVSSPYVIRVLREMLVTAVNRGASDIHFEPLADSFRVRARLDGVLHTLFDVNRVIAYGVLPRIKMVSNMEWKSLDDEIPQDGRISCNLIPDRSVDVRVSVLPTLHGEKAVLRILDKDKKQLKLSDLSLEERHLDTLQKEIKKPNGLLLVTGPTGCGKTTTLYSFLSELNSEHVNISTAEDPVEYSLSGITQINCDKNKGISFAATLRSLLRQDPDIIMIGEIRDFETADMAVKAASTGHLVFSTLHTNDAPGAIIRMINLGVPPFLIASCGLTVLAQRLIRLTCNGCKEEYVPEPSIIKALKLEQSDMVFYKGSGCKECTNTGYRGRESIMEILSVDDDIERLILEQRPVGEIKAAALNCGMSSLREEALKKLRSGVTTPDEILRVTIDA